MDVHKRSLTHHSSSHSWASCVLHLCNYVSLCVYVVWCLCFRVWGGALLLSPLSVYFFFLLVCYAHVYHVYNRLTQSRPKTKHQEKLEKKSFFLGLTTARRVHDRLTAQYKAGETHVSSGIVHCLADSKSLDQILEWTEACACFLSLSLGSWWYLCVPPALYEW